MAQGAGRAQRPRGETRLVASFEHGRQRQNTHGDNSGADNAGTRRQQHANKHHRQTEPAGYASEHHRHIVQQVFGDSAFFQHGAHKDKQRHGEQVLIR